MLKGPEVLDVAHGWTCRLLVGANPMDTVVGGVERSTTGNHLTVLLHSEVRYNHKPVLIRPLAGHNNMTFLPTQSLRKIGALSIDHVSSL
jgi:hypothetical protein